MSGGSYLDRILPAVEARLADRKRRVPLEKIKEEALLAVSRQVASQQFTGQQFAGGPALKGRFAGRPAAAAASFAAALRAPGVSVIAEVKRASPSKGVMRNDLDVAALVQAYERGGAAAVSVLTEEDHFLGSLADLGAATAATALPLLRKDFIVDEYQVYEARAYGAAAILLIAAVLPPERLEVLASLAYGLGMDVLLEVHDERELGRALAVNGALIGINNRDLRTFAVSLETTTRLAPLVPADRVVVAESGICSAADVAKVAAAGVDAVLVGETLVRSSNPEAALRALLSAAGEETQ